MKRTSQCDLIAAVLADGKPHTAAEIHRRCGFSRLNSRIAELRSRRSMNIVCNHIPGAGHGADAYEYTLIGSLLREPSIVGAGGAARDGSLSGDLADVLDTPSVDQGERQPDAAQLSVYDLLEAAA